MAVKRGGLGKGLDSLIPEKKQLKKKILYRQKKKLQKMENR